MGLEKAIKHGKEHRRKFSGAKSVSYSCRNHGECPWCRGNRLHSRRKSEEKNEDDYRSFVEENC